MWTLDYDGSRHGFIFYPYRQNGSTEIFTGNNSAGSGVWIKVQVEYKADAAGGGATLYLNGVTRSAWGVRGNYSRSANLQRIQLWNEGLTNNDFDDVTVYTIPPPGVNSPGAPTNVTGSPLDRAVSVTWTAPTSNGGSPITGYRITPFVGSTAQAPVLTGSPATTSWSADSRMGSATRSSRRDQRRGDRFRFRTSPPVSPRSLPRPGPPTNVSPPRAMPPPRSDLDTADV